MPVSFVRGFYISTLETPHPLSVNAIADSLEAKLNPEAKNQIPRTVLLQYARELQKNWSAEALDFVCEFPKPHRSVINATGIVLHTNMGRAPLGEKVIQRIASACRGYLDLELNLETGERGGRTAYLDSLISTLHGHYKPVWVNNGAAAVWLALNTFKKVFEISRIIISRGEMVEIGGGFRIPEIMKDAGFNIIEIGTTNKTRLKDYRDALESGPAILVSVHPSNFVIEGFTEKPTLQELTDLAVELDVPFFYDAGTLTIDEIRQLPKGIDAVSLSTDKTLAGPQGGLILARPKIQKELLKNNLYRALRLDKIAISGLEAVFESHIAKTDRADLPAARMLHGSLHPNDIQQRAQALSQNQFTHFELKVISIQASLGGGSWPGESWKSFGVHLAPKHSELTPSKLTHLLRTGRQPIVGMIQDDRVCLSLATVLPEQDQSLLEALRELDLALPRL